MTWTASMRMSSFEPCGSLALCAVWFRQLTSLQMVSQPTHICIPNSQVNEGSIHGECKLSTGVANDRVFELLERPNCYFSDCHDRKNTASRNSDRRGEAQPLTTTTMATETEEMLRLASSGFDLLFANDIDAAMRAFSADGQDNSPFHLMGLGVCAFLKAALGMEVGLSFLYCSLLMETVC